MEFRKMCVNAVSFGVGTTQIGLDRLRREGKDTRALEEIMAANEQKEKPVPHVNFDDGSESHKGRTVRVRAVPCSHQAHARGGVLTRAGLLGARGHVPLRAG
jgi:hypothetical protein